MAGLWENVLDLLAIKLPTANAGQYAPSLRIAKLQTAAAVQVSL